MVNEDYSPSEGEDEILETIKDGRDQGEPWGYTTPRHLKEQTSVDDDNVGYYLRQLTTAGWLQKVTRGFYRFVCDPREAKNGSNTNTNE